MVNMENQLRQTSLDVEHQKGVNEQTRVTFVELKKQVDTKEKDFKNLERDMHRSMFEVHKKQGIVDSLLRKLEQLTEKSGVGVSHTNFCNIWGFKGTERFP
jgi:septal ring factor EnvC (AmiA/AmiB activator)